MTFLLARRHDYLCGRLISLCYALAAGRQADMPVRFSWPQGEIYPMRIMPEDVFSAAFLDEHFLDESVVFPLLRKGNAILKDETLTAKDKHEMMPYRVIGALNAAQIPKDLVPEPMPSFHEVLPPEHLNPTLHKMCDQFANETYAGVHIRHGDLVRGNWRHFGHMGRFVPYDAAHDFISRHCPPGEYRIHSDEPEAARHLSQVACAAGDNATHRYIPSPSPDLLDRDIFDVFHMAYAQRIIAPVNSSYSQFAALYLGRETQVMQPVAMADWAEREVARPSEIIAPDYTAKRHLYIVEVLHKTGRADKHLPQIARLLDHAEQNWPYNAELYLQLMRFHAQQGGARSFEQLAEAYVELVSGENEKQLRNPGVIMLGNLRQEFLENNEERLAIVDGVIAALKT